MAAVTSGSPREPANVSLSGSPSNQGAHRPPSERADDMLPKGTVFRWNPYVVTPTNNNNSGGAGQSTASGAGRGAPASGDPADAVTPGHRPDGGAAQQQQRSGQYLATTSPSAAGRRMSSSGVRVGAPIDIVSPRADTAGAQEYGATPLADDGPKSPFNAAGFVGLEAATVDPETGEALPRRTVEVSSSITLASDSSSAVERTIVALLEEQRDSAVSDRVRALPQAEANVLYAYLAKHPDVCEYLCLKQRGKIFADVIEAASGALDNADLFRWLLARLPTYALEQSGCIAVTRVYDVVASVLRAQIDDYVALNLVPLASHNYGNYVVQRVITSGNPDIADALSRQLRSRGVVAGLTTSKAGSHVVERFVAVARARAALPVCQQLLLNDAELVRSLANDRYGNYVLQASLRRVFGIKKIVEDPTAQVPAPATDNNGNSAPRETREDLVAVAADAVAIAEQCLTVIPPLVADTQHAANISRAMGVRTGPAKGGGATPAGSGSHAAGDAEARPASGGPAVRRGGPRVSAANLRRGGAPRAPPAPK